MVCFFDLENSKIDYFYDLLSSYYQKRMRPEYITLRAMFLRKFEKTNDTKIIQSCWPETFF